MGAARKVPAAAGSVARLAVRRDRRASAVRAAIAAAVRGREPTTLAEARRHLAGDRTPVDGSTVADVHAGASKPPHWARFLHTLTGRLAPTSVVELGTAVGMSACAIASALPDGGRLWSVEMAKGRSAAAGRMLSAAGLDGRVRLVVGEFDTALDGVLAAAKPVDLMFIDGHHQQQPTLDYFDRAIPALASGAVVVFDDIHWSAGMSRAWRTIRDDQRVGWTVDLGGLGVAVTGPV